MALHSPVKTTHPSVPDSTWTKVSTVKGRDRRYLCLANEDQANVFRFELVAPGGSAPTLATEGKPLGFGANGTAGGTYIEDYDCLTTGDAYVYQASGGALTTLAVTEGV